MAVNTSNLVKSYSNYVIQEEHQTTKKGKIYERDITTIGGRNSFDAHQRPVYTSGNFIITTSVDETLPKPKNTVEWDKTPDGDSDLWTWDDVEDVTQEDDASIEIELKPDVYDLRSFAYFGSCIELIRASLNHIISIFPGEVYATNQPLAYIDKKNGSHKFVGGSDYFYIENPFNINLHETFVDASEIGENVLKFFGFDETYKEYEFIDSNGNRSEITNVKYTPVDKDCVLPYGLMGNLTVNSYTIYVYKDESNGYIYLTKGKNGWHIRPKETHMKNFRSKLSLFEKTLLTKSTTPIYSPKFEVYTEFEYGFKRRLQTFSFPIGEGGYNLGILLPAYSVYVNSLTKIATLYDEYFCDNLYRSMTHEAIKNFDWSFKREYTDKEEDQYLEGGGRMQKTIRLIGREFDEIKLYIDGIKSSNRVTYDVQNNLPDYFLTDQVELEGWDYKHITPFVKNAMGKFAESINSIQPYNFEGTTDECDKECFTLEKIKTYQSDLLYTPKDINNLFCRLLKLNSRSIWKKKGTINGIESLLALFGLKSKSWCEEKNLFQKRFNNSAASGICQNRDKYACIDDNSYDYEIIEYITTADPIDMSSTINNSIKISDIRDIINDEGKLIAYPEDVYLNQPHTPWRGLMVKEQDGKLYPYFSKDEIYDGNPYYQMNGGWLNKEYSLDKNDEIIKTNLFTETIRRIRGVNTIKDLLDLPYSILSDGEICYVANLDNKYIVLDGYAYEIFEYSDDCYYFDVTVRGGSVLLGDKLYSNSLHVKEPSVDENGNITFNEQIIPIGEYDDNSVVRLYITQTNGKWEFVFSDIYGTLPNYTSVILGNETFGIIEEPLTECDKIDCLESTVSSGTASHYFKLNNKNSFRRIYSCNQLTDNKLKLGWNQLSEDSDEFKHLELMQDYYKGNNPHTMTNKADFGYGYMEHFIKLFKYTIDNGLFDWDFIFSKFEKHDSLEQSELMDAIYNFGFEGIAKENCNEYNIIPSSKIFCSANCDDELKNDYFNEGDNKLSSMEIINTKRVDIKFMCNPEKEIEKFKYINDVVLHYLTQIIPSTLIISISYSHD